MSLRLQVDGERWRHHLDQVSARHPHLVPVAKGNGYGFGLDTLATEAQRLGVKTLAVGQYNELNSVGTFDGDVTVLTPWRPFENVVGEKIIHTIGRLSDIEQVQGRVILERMTSMRRFGFGPKELARAAKKSKERGLVVEGVSFHLPLNGAFGQLDRLMTDVIAAGLAGPIWVSHLTDDELDAAGARYPDFEFRPRIGTALWLGARDCLEVKATVLDRHEVSRGENCGYRGRGAPRSGTILIVSGGTAHGIGLEAPVGDRSVKARAAAIARGGLEASGLFRSPFTVCGKQRLFVEPPHMQSSMLFIPEGSSVPEVGDEVSVRVRYTATTFDAITFD